MSLTCSSVKFFVSDLSTVGQAKSSRTCFKHYVRYFPQCGGAHRHQLRKDRYVVLREHTRGDRVEPQRITHYPRQERRSGAVVEVEVFESPGETWDVLGIVSPTCPYHVCAVDPFEEDIVEIGEHGDKERQGRGESLDEPQLQGAEGVSDGFETLDDGRLLEPTHVERRYR
jgi:hypothetical protein